MSTEFVFEKRNFLGIPPEATALQPARFVVLPIPYERTSPWRRGAKYGCIAMIEASHQLELLDEETGQETWKSGVHTMRPLPIIDPPSAFFTSVANAVEPIVRMGKVLFTIGGEHAITEGPLQGVRRVHRKLSVLHLDAHADLRTSWEGSPHNQACTAQRMLKHCDKLVQVGVRSVAAEEQKSINQGKVRTFLAHEHRDMAALRPKVLAELGDPVYVTIDLSVFDPSQIPGVGSPQPGGYGWYEILDLLRDVAAQRTIVAVDVVELCPQRDSVASELAAAKLVYRLMGWLHRKDAKTDTRSARGGSHRANGNPRSTRRIRVEKR